MVGKNLFLYDLAVVAIFKDEGKYLREWIDYHLLAGVEHFYLYNNDSSDDYAEVLAPYVENNLVTLTDWPGRLVMYSAYNDAIARHRFACRYMAFIDLDEFIYPKTNKSIVEAIDEVFSRDPNAAALGINWQMFGSNGEIKADYTRGVLERFTRRAKSDWVIFSEDKTKPNIGNIFVKSIVNPRLVDYYLSPHYAIYFKGLNSISSGGKETYQAGNYPICADKIVINHYYTKSKEEYEKKKLPKGSLCFTDNPYVMEGFYNHDRNEVFDDGILKYRAARADSFALESDADKIRRVEKALIETLTKRSPLDAPTEFFVGKLETFLTCRALAEFLGTKIGNKSAEEYALVWIYQTLNKDGVLTYAELQLFIDSLPEILSRHFPLAKKIVQSFSARVLPAMIDATKNFQTWKVYKNLNLLRRLLESI